MLRNWGKYNHLKPALSLKDCICNSRSVQFLVRDDTVLPALIDKYKHVKLMWFFQE